MPTLNHVCKWTQNGWVHITAEKAAEEHPGGTVSAHSGLFMCSLCGQYVTLTDGMIRDRYFKHSSKDADKSCPERASAGFSYAVLDAKKHELPIKILFDKNEINFSVGLLYIPDEILNVISDKKVKIVPSGSKKVFKYSFERLSDKGITYVQTGNEPAEKYKIITDKRLSPYWPEIVNGIDPAGTIFEKKTGLKLAYDADVVINKKYLYLGTRKFYKNYESLEIKKITEKKISYMTWYLYEITAEDLTEEAAKFFLTYHCRLTASAVSLQPVWPVYEKDPYKIRFNSEEIYMYINGQNDVRTAVYPMCPLKNLPCRGYGKLQRIKCNERQQIISAGRANVLQYVYLWRDLLNSVTKEPAVQITDSKGQILKTGEYFFLPEKRYINIMSPYDGKVIVIKNGITEMIYKTQADKKISVDNVSYNTEIKVLVGLDVVETINFVREKNNKNNNDIFIANRLNSFNGKMINVPHSLGALSVYLTDYPETKKWLYKKIKSGKAPAEAIKYLKNFIIDKK